MQGMDDAAIMDFSSSFAAIEVPCSTYSGYYNQQFDALLSSSRVRVSCTLQVELEFLARVRVRVRNLCGNSSKKHVLNSNKSTAS